MPAERFDGLDVEEHLASFKGKIDVEPGQQRLDGVTVWVIACREARATHDFNKDGSVRRSSTLEIEGYVELRGRLRSDAIRHMSDAGVEMVFTTQEAEGLQAAAPPAQPDPPPVQTPVQNEVADIPPASSEGVEQMSDEFEVGDSDPGAPPIDPFPDPLPTEGLADLEPPEPVGSVAPDPVAAEPAPAEPDPDRVIERTHVVDDEPPERDLFKVKAGADEDLVGLAEDAGLAPTDADGDPAAATREDLLRAGEVDVVGVTKIQYADDALQAFMDEEDPRTRVG